MPPAWCVTILAWGTSRARRRRRDGPSPWWSRTANRNWCRSGIATCPPPHNLRSCCSAADAAGLVSCERPSSRRAAGILANPAASLDSVNTSTPRKRRSSIARSASSSAASTSLMGRHAAAARKAVGVLRDELRHLIVRDTCAYDGVRRLTALSMFGPAIVMSCTISGYDPSPETTSRSVRPGLAWKYFPY